MWNDTSTLFHIRQTDLIAIETLRYHLRDTTQMITRSIIIRERQADTAAAASTALRSDSAVGITQTITTSPLTVESKKKGRAPLCANWLIVVLIIFMVFVIWGLRVKRK